MMALMLAGLVVTATRSSLPGAHEVTGAVNFTATVQSSAGVEVNKVALGQGAYRVEVAAWTTGTPDAKRLIDRCLVFDDGPNPQIMVAMGPDGTFEVHAQDALVRSWPTTARKLKNAIAFYRRGHR